MDDETGGTLLALLGMTVYGIEPVIINANPSAPIGFAALSATVASLILWPAMIYTGGTAEIRENPSQLWKGALVGLFGTALAYTAYSYGARMSTAVNAAIITRSEVLWSIVLSWSILRERINGRFLGSVFLILTGLMVLITGGGKVKPHPGDLLLLLVPLFWQIGHVIAKRLPYGPLTIATLRNTFGALLLAPAALAGGMEPTRFALLEGLMIALGQVIWYGAIKRINLSKATAIITPAPVVAMVLSITSGEKLTALSVLSFILVSAGTLGAVRTESELRT